MWRIRITKLFSEVGGLISGAEVKFTSPGGHERVVSGKLTTEGAEQVFDMPGPRGVLTVEQGDRVVMDFEVLVNNDDELPTEEQADETA